ncbi:MAG: site-specific integrase [Kofleriaceae bacterium]
MPTDKRTGNLFARPMVLGTTTRLYVTPKTYGLPNTKGGLKEAVRRAMNDALNALSPTIRNDNTQLAAPSATPVALATKEVPTFATFANDVWLANALIDNKPASIKTKRRFLRVVSSRFDRLRLDEIDPAAIDSWRADMAAKYKPNTSNTYLNYMGAIVRMAAARRVIDAAPRVRLFAAPLTVVDFLSKPQMDQLVAACDLNIRAMVDIACRTGLRIGELRALRWANVDLVARTLLVCENYVCGTTQTPKSGRNRVVVLSPDTVAILTAHRAAVPQQGGAPAQPWVFVTGKGRRMNHSELYNRLYAAQDKAGLPQFGWHLLRHSYASHLTMDGVVPAAVAELLGHSDLKQLQRYAHLSRSHMTAAVANVDLGRQDRRPSNPVADPVVHRVGEVPSIEFAFAS